MKRTVIAALTAFAVLLIVVAVLNWRASRRLERRIIAIRAAGDPVTLADLAGEPVPSEQNAETYLRRVDDDVAAMSKELYVLYSQPDAYYVNGQADGKLNEAGAELVRAAFAAYPEVVPAIEKAVACQELDLQLDYTLERELVIADLPRYKADSEIKQIRQQAGTSGTLTKLVFPALHATRDAVDRTRANIRCLRVLNAWLAYSEAHGAAPKTLVELGLDGEALVDPYNGKPLVDRETPEGLIVYSVGADGNDDGGTSEGMKDVVAGPVAVR